MRRLEVRVGPDASKGLLIVDFDESLGITPGEVIDRFGTAGVSGPSLHAPAGEPYCYIYGRPNGELRICIRPGKPHRLVRAIWDDEPL